MKRFHQVPRHRSSFIRLFQFHRQNSLERIASEPPWHEPLAGDEHQTTAMVIHELYDPLLLIHRQRVRTDISQYQDIVLKQLFARTRKFLERGEPWRRLLGKLRVCFEQQTVSLHRRVSDQRVFQIPVVVSRRSFNVENFYFPCDNSDRSFQCVVLAEKFSRLVINFDSTEVLARRSRCELQTVRDHLPVLADARIVRHSLLDSPVLPQQL